MELQELTGKHYLKGVEFSKEDISDTYSFGNEANAIMFTLDNKTYKVIEDPEDGYRSYMKDIQVYDSCLLNKFPAQEVVGKMKEDSDYERHNVLQLIDVNTGKIVLEVGTEDCADYYPVFVAYWEPRNLSINTEGE